MTDPARDPIEMLREALHLLARTLPMADGEMHESPALALAALSRLEALRDAARAADAVLYEHMPEWYGDREWPELDNLRAALAACDNETSGGTATLDYRLALQECQGAAISVPEAAEVDDLLARLDRIDQIVTEALGGTATPEPTDA
jgi:hypothetical protein